MAKRKNKSCVQFLYFNQRHYQDKAKNKTVLMQWIFPMNKSPKTILISNLYILFLYSIKIHHKIIFIWKSIFFSDFINRPKIHFLISLIGVHRFLFLNRKKSLNHGHFFNIGKLKLRSNSWKPLFVANFNMCWQKISILDQELFWF